MKLYSYLSSIGILKNYSIKFLSVAFIGIHIPLLGIIAALIYTSGPAINKVPLFLLTLVLTLLATAITLLVLNALVLPLKKAQVSLANYLNNKSIPDLPNGYTDEVGVLMRDINTVITTLHNNIEEKDKVIKALSHNLRASATNILTSVNSIRNENDPAETNKYLTSIANSVNQQVTIIDDIVHSYETK